MLKKATSVDAWWLYRGAKRSSGRPEAHGRRKAGPLHIYLSTFCLFSQAVAEGRTDYTYNKTVAYSQYPAQDFGGCYAGYVRGGVCKNITTHSHDHDHDYMGCAALPRGSLAHQQEHCAPPRTATRVTRLLSENVTFVVGASASTLPAPTARNEGPWDLFK